MEFDSDAFAFFPTGEPQKLSGDPAVHLSGGGNQGVTRQLSHHPRHAVALGSLASQLWRGAAAAGAAGAAGRPRRQPAGVEQLHNINEKRK